jgi:hypothetical protein
MFRQTLHRAYAIAALCLLSVTTASAQGFHYKRSDVTDSGSSCFVRGGDFRLGGNWPRSMAVASGSPCGGTFSAAGRVTFKRLYLTSPPQHGRVVLQEGGHYHYTSAAGYHGSDSFSLRVCGVGPRGEGCGNLHYAVTVQ